MSFALKLGQDHKSFQFKTEFCLLNGKLFYKDIIKNVFVVNSLVLLRNILVVNCLCSFCYHWLKYID